MKRNTILYAVIIAILAAMVQPAAAQTGIDVSKLAVISADDLGPLTQGNNLYLSPDGTRIAQTNGKTLCILSASGQQQACADEIKAGISLSSVQWSPDSTHLAFTEDFFRFFRDPDIWVLDATTGKAKDMTDDGTDKYSFTDRSKNGNLDLLPVWNPDGKSLFFIRYVEKDKLIYAVLHSINVDGSDLKELGPLSATGLFTDSLAAAPDGKRLAHNYGNSCKSGGDLSSIWLVDATGKNDQQIWHCTEADSSAKKTWQNTIAESLVFSLDGQYILAIHPEILVASPKVGDATSNHVSPVDGSDAVAVDADHIAQMAAWSPTGSALVYIVKDPANPDQEGLYVVDKPGRHGRLLYQGNFWTATASASWRGLSWASNNTILVLQDNKEYKLLHLGTK